ncbi:MAG: hypothetical protein ABJD53_05580 [Gammaproteobacteria bacterium]
MTRDVYAGDESPTGDRDVANDNRTSRLNIAADDAPEVLHRVAAVLTALNASPEYFLLERTAEETLRIEVHLRGASDLAIDMLRRKLMQLTCVAAVAVQHIY